MEVGVSYLLCAKSDYVFDQNKTEALIYYTIRVLLLLLTTKLLLQPPHAFTIPKTLYKLKLLAIRFV